jgi:hypothetical protein
LDNVTGLRCQWYSLADPILIYLQEKCARYEPAREEGSIRGFPGIICLPILVPDPASLIVTQVHLPGRNFALTCAATRHRCNLIFERVIPPVGPPLCTRVSQIAFEPQRACKLHHFIR